MKYITSLLFALLFPITTQAHMLWLERATDLTTKAYFGEISDNPKIELETQDGRLKTFNDAKATQGKKQFTAQIHPNFLQYKTEGHEDVKVKNDVIYRDMLAQFSAKAGLKTTTASAELDIIPTAVDGKKFTLIFQGKPFAKQNILVNINHKITKKYKTDALGQFNLETPVKGQYVIEAGKEVKEPGQYNGVNYKRSYLISTLSFNHD